VNLIRNKDEYVSTTGGEVTLDYGSPVADLAVRLGVDPATISEIRRVVQNLSTDVKQSLSTAQARIESVRAELARVQGGSLGPQLQQDLGTLQQSVAELQTKIASLEETISLSRAVTRNPRRAPAGTLTGSGSLISERIQRWLPRAECGAPPCWAPGSHLVAPSPGSAAPGVQNRSSNAQLSRPVEMSPLCAG
jgi:hypothetical protein